jgi:hypothetical protein
VEQSHQVLRGSGDDAYHQILLVALPERPSANRHLAIRLRHKKYQARSQVPSKIQRRQTGQRRLEQESQRGQPRNSKSLILSSNPQGQSGDPHLPDDYKQTRRQIPESVPPHSSGGRN